MNINHGIPKSYCCPLTKMIFHDPCTIEDDPSKMIYEREALERWLLVDNKKTSPITGMVLENRNIVSSTLMKNVVNKFLNDNFSQYFQFVYFPFKPQISCIDAVQKNDISTLSKLIENDQRLIERPLVKINKNLIFFAAEFGKIGVIKVILTEWKKILKSITEKILFFRFVFTKRYNELVILKYVYDELDIGIYIKSEFVKGLNDNNNNLVKGIVILISSFNSNLLGDKINGSTFLHLAVMKENVEIVSFLVKSNYDLLFILNSQNVSPIDLIISKHYNREIFRFCVNLKSIKGQTGWLLALHTAARTGNDEIVEILLRNEADPYVKDSFDKTPMDYARENNHLNIIQVLNRNLKIKELAPILMPIMKIVQTLKEDNLLLKKRLDKVEKENKMLQMRIKAVERKQKSNNGFSNEMEVPTKSNVVKSYLEKRIKPLKIEKKFQRKEREISKESLKRILVTELPSSKVVSPTKLKFLLQKYFEDRTGCKVDDVRLGGNYNNFGFVDFYSADGVERAINLKSPQILGKEFSIKRCEERKRRNETYTLDDLKNVFTIYVCPIDSKISVDSLHDYFKDCGEVHDIRISTKGFAHIEFKESKSVFNALKNKHNTIFNGRKIIVDASCDIMPQFSIPVERHIFVGGLPKGMNEDEIKNFFNKKIGAVDKILFHSGFCYVYFKSVSHAKRAYRLDDTEIRPGRKIDIYPQLNSKLIRKLKPIKIYGIKKEMKQRELKRIFRECGVIYNVSIRGTNAVIGFGTESDRNKALKKNGFILKNYGTKIKVIKFDKEKSYY